MHDPAFNVAYIRLRKKSATVTTRVVSDQLNIDIGPDGALDGIELRSASERPRNVVRVKRFDRQRACAALETREN